MLKYKVTATFVYKSRLQLDNLAKIRLFQATPLFMHLLIRT